MKATAEEQPKEQAKKEILLDLNDKPKPLSSGIKTRVMIKNLTKETIGNETSQAIIRIFDTKYMSLKIFWIICLLGCVSLCGYLVAKSFLTYLSFPVYTTTTLVNEVPTVFPKITICNSNIPTTEYAFEIIKEINEELKPNLSIFNQTQMSQIAWKDASNIFWSVFTEFHVRINSETFSDAYRKKLVHSFEDVLIDCSFNGQLCTSFDFIWKWDPVYGNCYVFNSGLNTSGSKVSYKESVLPGALSGLQLVAYVGYNEKLIPFNPGYFSWVPFSNSYGLNVLIENNTYLSYEKTNVIILNGGTMNFMPIHRRFASKLPKPYSNCDIDNSNPDTFDSPYYNLIKNSPYQYSQELCILQCFQKQIIDLCNCSTLSYVSLYNASCHNERESECSFWEPFEGNVSSKIPNCIPQCPLECNSTEMSFTLTSQTFSGNGYAFLVNESHVLSSDFISSPITDVTASNKFVQFFAYYDSLSFTSSEDSPSMDIVAFLGNIGGTLGLFLGICVLSVCEFIHVIVENCILVKDRLKQAKKLNKI
jgi:hypothetical protein